MDDIQYDDCLIDSKKRNVERFPKQSRYRIDFHNDKSRCYKHLQLSPQLHLPFTRPLIHAKNKHIRIIDYLENNIEVDFQCGNYNNRCPSTLAQMMTSTIDQFVQHQKISVMYDQMIGKFTFTSNKGFTIHCEQMGTLLGFDRNEPYTAKIDFTCGNFLCKADFCYNFENNVIKIAVSELQSPTNPLGIIGVVTPSSVMTPMMQLTSLLQDDDDGLELCFYDEDDIEYDFDNADHYLVLRFFYKSYIHPAIQPPSSLLFNNVFETSDLSVER